VLVVMVWTSGLEGRRIVARLKGRN